MLASPMRSQIVGAAQAIDSIYDALEVDVRTKIATPDIYRFRHVVVTGCGDSLFAAKSVELAMTAQVRLPVSVRPSLEVGRYLANAVRQQEIENTLLICISNSGEAARVVEAAQVQAGRGATVLALTGNKESRLARAAHHVLGMKLPPLPSAPGFAGYTATQVALILMAIRFGEVRMEITMDEAQALRGSLKKCLADLHNYATDGVPDLSPALEKLVKARLIEVVAPNIGVAEFGAAKFLEATGRHALARDVEEWMHLNYFDGAPEEIATCLIIPPNSASRSRIEEVEFYMTKLGRRLIRIGDDGIPMIEAPNEFWAPLFSSAPVALLAADLAVMDGAEYGRGAAGKWEDCADARTVQSSKILGA